MTHSATPSEHPRRRRPTSPVGLYDPAFEHDSCGVAFVARLNGVASHETVERALRALANLEHRGAAGADPLTGDGAGMLAPAARRVLPRRSSAEELPPAGRLRGRVCFLPRDDEARRAELEQLLVDAVEAEGQRVIAWRDVPVELEHVGETARDVAPVIRQLLVAASAELAGDRDAFERKLYVIRRVAEIAAGPELVIPSFSAQDDRLQGDADGAAARARASPTCATSGSKSALACPLALLDEHVPELGARPPLPHDRPQRRDQHGARQRQLDARPRVAARLRALRRRPRRRCCRSSGRAAPTRRTSTTCSSCSCSRAARCRTR